MKSNFKNDVNISSIDVFLFGLMMLAIPLLIYDLLSKMPSIIVH